MLYKQQLVIFALAAWQVTAAASGNMSPEWAAAYVKAGNAVQKMSLNDKATIATGVGILASNCIGNIAAVPSVNFTGLCLEDSPIGVRFVNGVSVFPAEINVAATFNRTLMNLRGAALGKEFKGVGVHVGLGPMMNLMRSPAAGRNWEGFGADPYLSGEGAYYTIEGMQSSGAQACAKHFINNEQEHYRTTESSNVDDRTQHELYLQPFLRAVQANVASVMCSYNLINGSYACQNDKMLNGILKTELGFPGYVMSDWGADESGVPAINAGLDMDMPGGSGSVLIGPTYFGNNIVTGVNNGSLSETRIDDLATRILAGWYLLGQDQGYPNRTFSVALDIFSDGGSTPASVTAGHDTLIRDIGSASTVLLKNTRNTLPFKKPTSLALIGSAATSNLLGPNACMDRTCNSGTLASGWGSGTANFPYLTTPLSAITARAQLDNTKISSYTLDSDILGAAYATARGKSAAIVFITADSGEGSDTVEGNAGDRNDLEAWHNGAALVQAIASVNNNTIVVVQTVGAVDVESFVENPNVTAIVWSGLGGQEAGNSLTDILYGAVNPSGRLPYTIGKSITDYPAAVLYSSSDANPQINYTEGLFIDYRHFDAAGIAPRYEFGFGLSYTTFAYSSISVSGSVGSYTPPSGPGSSLDASLHAKVFTVSFTLTNNGTVAGHEVPQLYISPPASSNSPLYQLRGFDSVFLAPGASTTVSFQLSRYDLSFWNVVTQRWEIPSGQHGVTVGASSRDRRLSSAIVI